MFYFSSLNVILFYSLAYLLVYFVRRSYKVVSKKCVYNENLAKIYKKSKILFFYGFFSLNKRNLEFFCKISNLHCSGNLV